MKKIFFVVCWMKLNGLERHMNKTSLFLSLTPVQISIDNLIFLLEPNGNTTAQMTIFLHSNDKSKQAGFFFPFLPGSLKPQCFDKCLTSPQTLPLSHDFWFYKLFTVC